MRAPTTYNKCHVSINCTLKALENAQSAPKQIEMKCLCTLKRHARCKCIFVMCILIFNYYYQMLFKRTTQIFTAKRV